MLNTLATAALIYGVFQQLRGSHASMLDCVSMGLKRLILAVMVALVAGICIGFGVLLLIVPGLILLCMFYVAIPAAVIERTGVFESLKRSKDLTHGYKGTIFMIWLILVIGVFATNTILGANDNTEYQTIAEMQQTAYIDQAIQILWGSIQAVVTAVVYHDLRHIKDGVDVEDLVRVFE